MIKKSLTNRFRENVTGNCDTLLYLGGNEQATHEYISKMLGKETIDTRTRGITKGQHGSSNTNYQNAGRELLTLDEVRLLDNSNALIFVRGERPMMDKKFDILSHPNVARTADGKAKPYTHRKASRYFREDLSFDVAENIANVKFITRENGVLEKRNTDDTILTSQTDTKGEAVFFTPSDVYTDKNGCAEIDRYIVKVMYETSAEGNRIFRLFNLAASQSIHPVKKALVAHSHEVKNADGNIKSEELITVKVAAGKIPKTAKTKIVVLDKADNTVAHDIRIRFILAVKQRKWRYFQNEKSEKNSKNADNS